MWKCTEKRRSSCGSDLIRLRRHEQPKERIAFALFSHIVLNELLRAHVDFLRPLNNAFKLVDVRSNGFLRRTELASLFEQMDHNKTLYGADLTELVDREFMDVITFSSLVKELAQKTIGEERDRVTLLQYFCGQSN